MISLGVPNFVDWFCYFKYAFNRQININAMNASSAQRAGNIIVIYSVNVLHSDTR